MYQKGSLFCNLLLADELNRASPKTQSALLEAMEERTVSVEGITRALPSPFFVIATRILMEAREPIICRKPRWIDLWCP